MTTPPAPYDRVAARLAQRLPESRIVTDPLRLMAWGTDASLYRLVPKIVVVVESEDDVSFLLTVCREHKVPLTFRAAGTSLSGQAISDSVLAVLGDAWNWSKIEDGGAKFRVRPGMIGAECNRRLLPYGRKIGPDPASIDACKIGGIVNNNSSGMCCGVAQNTYHTMDALRFMLADGTILDTGDETSRAIFRQSHAGLLNEIDAMAREVKADESFAARIKHKFRIKCTTGYSINAFVDYDDPIDVLAHLLVGSEGTLGFVSEVVFNTVPEHGHKATAFLIFPDIVVASQAVMALESQPVAAVELFDRASMRSVEDKPGVPALVRGLPEDAAALLVETRAENPDDLAANVARVEASLAGIAMIGPMHFTTDAAEAAKLWNVRKGLIPSAGGTRPNGTSMIIEDVCFPMEQLAPAVRDLRTLLDSTGYTDATIFGHALAGNLHFLLAQDFDKPSEVERFDRFMRGLSDLVVGKYDGSLKAEHGTGRNVAPFVEAEWGTRAMELMRKVKRTIEPEGMLNPGVLVSDDPEAHIHDLKRMPIADSIIDKCIECGFCERMCPSKGMTLSPRQRIVGWREINRRDAAGEDSSEWRDLYDYQGIDTCAACGLCATVCPVSIDTGLLTRALRGKRRGPIARNFGTWASKHYAAVNTMTRAAFAVAGVARRALGAATVEDLSKFARRHLGDWVPLALRTLPNAAVEPKPRPVGAGEQVVYVSACTSRTMAPPDSAADQRLLPEVVESLLAKAGYAPVRPPLLPHLCCGLPFDSKGLADVAQTKANEMAEAILAAGPGLPVVMDASPCSLRIKQALAGRATVYDLPEFLHDQALPRLSIDKGDEPVLLHLPCSLKRMGGEAKLKALAESCSSQVTVPVGVNCCGFAGDKGLFKPELNQHALRHLCDEAAAEGIGVSSSRSCEIGLATYGNRSFQSIAYLLDARSVPKR
ncbi:MAG TPA: FAD-binding and (Fe-S)-binding domain-containing protein [Magnetospirillaceae bacterium]|jgi:D-lactate dehydrogenase